ncbi:MAG: 30S ribosomal protein S20 [Clostridiales bacterium]|nr:30S ribosomal protein S20 [Clostridiales bacterium]
MANIKSAKKRINTLARKREENKLVKSSLRTQIKKYKKALAEKDVTLAEALLKETISKIDAARSKGILHKNNASNKVARLSSAFDKLKKETATTEVKEVKAAKVEVAEVKAEENTEEKAPVKRTRKTTTKKAE